MMSSPSRAEATGTRAERQLILIEDNPADAMLAQAVHNDKSYCSWLKTFADPDSALEYLKSAGERPVVIIMDLVLPRRTALELIPEIRSVDGLETVPIVVLTGSDNPSDLARAYACGANCVVKKPNSWQEYVRILERSFDFWCTVV